MEMLIALSLYWGSPSVSSDIQQCTWFFTFVCTVTQLLIRFSSSAWCLFLLFSNCSEHTVYSELKANLAFISAHFCKLSKAIMFLERVGIALIEAMQAFEKTICSLNSVPDNVAGKLKDTVS